MSSETQQPRDAGSQRETDVYDLLAWLEVNKKKVAIAALVLVLIGFGIAILRYTNEQKELKASAALLALKPSLSQSTNLPPLQPTALLKVAEEYHGTAAAERAQLLAAMTFFTEGRYAEAEKQFSQFVKDHPESPWVAEAAFGIAASQEAQNKITEAQASYQHVMTAYANTSLADSAKLSLARIFEGQKKPDQALRLYNELLAPRPGGQPGEMRNATAFQKKEALLRVHPELSTNIATRPLPAPATVVTPSTNAPLQLNTNAPLQLNTNAPATAPASAEKTNAPAAPPK